MFEAIAYTKLLENKLEKIRIITCQKAYNKAKLWQQWWWREDTEILARYVGPCQSYNNGEKILDQT